MSDTAGLVRVLKAELKAAGMTYADLARELKLAESSVKRMLARGDMTLSRVDAICHVLRTDFAELSRQVADAAPPQRELTLEQERAVVADRKLLLVALSALSQWTLAQIVATYRLTEAEVVKALAQLDRLGVLELRAGNRYRLKVDKTFRWRPHGPVMAYFRDKVMADFFAGGFDGDGEMLSLVHGQLSPAQAELLTQRLRRVAQDFAQQHLADQHLDPGHKRPYTLLIGMRSWLFEVVRELRRSGR